MITKDQLTQFARKLKTNETVILREYLQLLFLATLYTFDKSRHIFFKGETAIHLLFGAPRFSEDLDFTVDLRANEFSNLIEKVFIHLSRESMTFKERKTIAGKRYLLTGTPILASYKIFINLDFSFREKIFEAQQSMIETDYPVLFTSFVHHLSMEELFAEKIRALLYRKKGRDLYDLWFLMTKGVTLKKNLIKEKLKYYGMSRFNPDVLQRRLKNISQKDFIADLRPFVPENERVRLKHFFEYIQNYLREKFTA